MVSLSLKWYLKKQQQRNAEAEFYFISIALFTVLHCYNVASHKTFKQTVGKILKHMVYLQTVHRMYSIYC